MTKFRNTLLIISLLILSGGIGYRLGEKRAVLNKGSGIAVINSTEPESLSVDFSLFWDVWNRVHRYYIDTQDIDNQKMVWGAISGMVNAVGDPYTTYLPPKENKEFKDDLGGSFEGIGAQLGLKDNRIIIVAPLKGNPAERAGLKAGDFILKVNEEDTLGWTVQEAVTKIRGPKGTTVVLNILHEGASKTDNVSVVRDKINVPAVESWIKPVSDITEVKKYMNPDMAKSRSEIAYVLLTRFGDNLETEWSKAINEIVNDRKNITGMVFDLRNNPGGYLDGSVYIGSEFIKEGVVVSQKNSDGSKQDYKVSRRGRLLDIPLVVIINKGSASASEIVAGALKDAKRAVIVGETSFGKGSVQSPQELKDGSSLHVTTGKWLTPKGDSITKTGITPDYIIELDSEEASSDAQLAKAIELLLKK